MAESSGTQTPIPEDHAVKPIEDAGTLHTALMITFLLSCLYFGITVTSTTHRLLLLGASLKLPLLDVSIPLEGFYVVAPAVILGVHIYLLLQYYVLVRRLRDPWTKLLGDDADFFLFPAVPVLRHVLRKEEPWVSKLIRLGLILINIALPVLVLCLAQYYFLPYHSFWITLWHQMLIVLDLIAVWYFFITIRHPVGSKQLERRVAMVVAIFLVLFYSFFLATVPGTWIESFTSKPFELPPWFQRNLKLSDQLLISEEPSQEVIAAFAGKNPDNSRDIYLRFAVGAHLQGRDLRYADLEQTKLFNADLRGADLRNARLVGADLSGANLNPKEHITLLHQLRGTQKSENIAHVLESGDFEPTQLDGARLAGANFQGATLILASMVGTDLQGANLDGLELTGANLSRAQLSGARLSGGELSRVKLDGAVLRNTHLEGAMLDHASLAGAIMSQVSAPAASFANADLQGAQLAEANLRGAVFLDARLIGSDLRRAHLQGASAIRFDRSDLRGSDLGAACDTSFNRLSDLRFIDFALPSAKDWKLWRDQIEARIKGIPQKEVNDVLARFDHSGRRFWEVWRRQAEARKEPRNEMEAILSGGQLPIQEAMEAQAACVGTALDTIAVNSNRKLLYLDEQRTGVMENWPPLERQNQGKEWDETVFQRDLAADLLTRICDSSGLARAMVFRAAGEYTPGDEALDLEISEQMLHKLHDPQNCAALHKILEERAREDHSDLTRQIAWRVRKHNHAMKEHH
jgi:uncharacterized protein YjbI with pentapeptide repeats